MKKSIVILGLMVVAGSVMAQTNVPANLPRRHPAGMQSGATDTDPIQLMLTEKGKQLRAELKVKDQECRNAESGIPEIKVLDDRINGLMKQVQELRVQKLELIKNNPVLAAKRKESAAVRRQLNEERRKTMPVPVMSSSADAK